MTVSTEHVFGLDFACDVDIAEIVDLLIEDRDAAPAWRCVVTPNVDHLVRYTRHPEESAAGHAATLVLPDGAPIVWASRLLGRPLARRLTGADLFAVLWPRLVADSVPIVVIAASSAVAERIGAAHTLTRCIVAPMFDVGDQVTIDRLVAEADAHVNEIDAQFVVVGVSMPKHHRIANALRALWKDSGGPMPTVLLVGAAPEFALGLTDHAPRWMQRTGTEWVHRLVTDPRRLAKRYLVDDTLFIWLVWREWREAGRRSTR